MRHNLIKYNNDVNQNNSNEFVPSPQEESPNPAETEANANEAVEVVEESPADRAMVDIPSISSCQVRDMFCNSDLKSSGGR